MVMRYPVISFMSCVGCSSFLSLLQIAKVLAFLVQRETNNTAHCGVVHSSLRLTKRLNNITLKRTIK